MYTYKFRLYPNKEQTKILFKNLNLCRFTYNQLLEELQHNKDKKHISHYILTLKEKYPQLKQVYSKTLQCLSDRIFSNIKGLAISKQKGNNIGRLRFKGRDWFKTIIYNQSGFKIFNTNKRHNRIHLSKIGDIKFLQHRTIDGKIKSVIIKKKVNSWEIHIITDKKYQIQKGANKIGIDLGINNFLVDNNNNKVDNPLYLKQSLEQVKQLHRNLSKKKLRSNNRYKCKQLLALKYERITEQRNDFLHKLTTKLINNNCYIAVEKLDIKKLQSISYNSRNINDSSWYRFIQLLKFKAESAGTTIIDVNPAYTTQTCNRCGNIQKMEISNRTYNCSKCNIIIDRDYNSAINIYKKSLEQGIVENNIYSMKQEAISSTASAVRV